MSLLKHYFKYNQESLLGFIAFFLGMFIFEINLVSFSQIIKTVGLENFSIVMIIVSFSNFFLGKLNLFFLKRKSNYVFPASIIVGLILIALNLVFKKNISFFQAMLIFVFGQYLANALDIYFSQITSINTSILKNPKITIWINILTEIGGLVAALSTFLLKESELAQAVKIIPAIIIILLIRFLHDKKIYKNNFNEVKKEKNNFNLIKKNPFIIYYLLFIFTLAISNNYFVFTFYIGMDSMSQYSNNVDELFSIFSFIQTLLVIYALFHNLLKVKITNDWYIKLTIFTIITIFLISIQSIYFLPLLLIICGILRKTIARILLNNSMGLLANQFPENDRINIRMLSEEIKSLSYLFIALVSFMTINVHIPLYYSGLMTNIILLMGLYCMKRLFYSLGQFHISNIVRSDIYHSIQSVYALGSKLYKLHCVALISLLERSPRAILQKAIIVSLGQIGDHRAIPVLIKTYETTKREDIQFLCIRSLFNFKSHYVRYKMMEYVSRMIVGQTSLGEIRKSVINEIIINFPKDTLIYTLYKILEDAKVQEDQRYLANVILVIGELANKTNDKNLYEIILPFLDLNYSRRVRSNAIIFLYGSKKFHEMSTSSFESLLTSDDELDIRSASFIIGELEMKNFKTFVNELSVNSNCNVSTYLVCLIKLNFSNAAKHFIDFIFNEKDESEIIKAINQFSVINKDYLRYKVYEELLNNYPNNVDYFINLLRKTKRNFDLDRTIIVRECKKRNIILNEDNIIFSTKNDHIKNLHLKKEVVVNAK